jgi:hypothetical protein
MKPLATRLDMALLALHLLRHVVQHLELPENALLIHML